MRALRLPWPSTRMSMTPWKRRSWDLNVTAYVTPAPFPPRPRRIMETQPLKLERVSIEVTNRCAKACWFCYNHSQAEGDTRWTPEELVAFVRDCVTHGIKAVSFG